MSVPAVTTGFINHVITQLDHTTMPCNKDRKEQLLQKEAM